MAVRLRYNLLILMVRDGIYYGLGCIAAAFMVFWLTGFLWLTVIPLLLAAFFLQFFRDPNRTIPVVPGGIVSPGDGKVTDISVVRVADKPRTRISIFLNVFNVHVNRAPIAGEITDVEYRKGQFRNAMGAVSAEMNEQNICTILGEDGQSVTFKQIAGLLARRIVFTKKAGDLVQRGERVGLIKFGSRVDVIFSADAIVAVRLGDKVKGGATLLATLPVPQKTTPASAGAKTERAR
ncbi:MAG TPA: phosphatidylserine decarboxylase [Clostridia bacterium]|nr:phosphatidylserine decarboxylase [Clostridia bacterium]